MKIIQYDNVIENESERDFYIETHKKILDFIEKEGETTFWKIVRKVQGSDRRILRLLNEMQLIEEIKIENKKISLINKKDHSLKSKDIFCKNCEGKIIQFDENWLNILKKMKEIYKNKPTPTFIYDQRPVNAKTTVRRAAYLRYKRDLIDKEIAVIGDDDLTSIAIGLTKVAKRVVVFDIDKRLVNYINKVSEEQGLNVKAYRYDLTKQIPKEFSNKFDVFLTDPTPNPDCFSLFVSIGLRLLKKESGCVGYVSFFPSHQKEEIDFQKILTDWGLIITDMIPKFTEYDFVEFTYRDKDKELLKKFDTGEERLSFTENITRFITSEDTLDIQYFNVSHFSPGKATQRVLENIEKDPAYMKGEKEFVLESIKEMELENET